MPPQKRENSEKVILRSSQRISVGKEDASCVAESRSTVENVLLQFRNAADAEFLLLVGRAENALVVGAADGVLKNKTVRLARRTDDGSFVFRHRLLYLFRFCGCWAGGEKFSMEEF